MPVKTYPITLERAEFITPSVKHFVFKHNIPGKFNFKAGQFITMHFSNGDKTLRRSYSLANQPHESERIEFAAGYVENGPGSEILFNLKPGDTININGPFGRLILKEEPVKRYILVATSTGVTPYRSMRNQIIERINLDPELQVIILQGVQRREDLLYGKEFAALAEQYPQVSFKAHYSREKDIELYDYEACGYVQTAFENLQLNPQHDIIYLCGNPGMIDESFSLLKQVGFEVAQIRREKYISN